MKHEVKEITQQAFGFGGLLGQSPSPFHSIPIKSDVEFIRKGIMEQHDELCESMNKCKTFESIIYKQGAIIENLHTQLTTYGWSFG